MISPGIFLYFFYFFIFVNIKMFTFFIGPLQQFFLNKWLFFKFLNKCQTEILGCAPTFFTCMWFLFSEMIDFYCIICSESPFNNERISPQSIWGTYGCCTTTEKVNRFGSRSVTANFSVQISVKSELLFSGFLVEHNLLLSITLLNYSGTCFHILK